MAKIVLDLSSDDAEAVMHAMKLRACQKRAPNGTLAQMERIRKQLEDEAVRKLGWQDFPAVGIAPRYPVDNDIRVSVVLRNRW